jgi:hypothetical protein
MHWKTVTVVVGAAVALSGTLALAYVDLPSGERQLANSILEPAYDDTTGNIIFVKTPMGPDPSNVDDTAVSPLYLVVYPNSAAPFVGTMNCAHLGGDNCPDHGPAISQLAASQFAFYGPADGSGVWGHDHLVVGTGGAGFNVVREIHVVLFTTEAASHQHVVTADQVLQLLASGEARDTVIGRIHASVVSAASYQKATPLVPALLSPLFASPRQ